MRLARFEHQNELTIGFYLDDAVVPLSALAAKAKIEIPQNDSLLDYLPGGTAHDTAQQLHSGLTSAEQSDRISVLDIELQVPIPQPPKLMLLAGNYPKHIEEFGRQAEERDKTFPYVFMKPAGTTLTAANQPIRIPEISPDHIDWEIELAIVIGKECKAVTEASALNYVAGYTIVNDISDRQFRPNPNRAERDRNKFFDWLHGKWHDTFCPMGPCVLSADALPDPQNLQMTLTVNDQIEQNGSTAEMVFPVAAVIEFISGFVRLQPGDVISTGTPHGVGGAKGRFLKPGDRVVAKIDQIGSLSNPITA